MKIENPTQFDVAALPLTGPNGRELLTVIVKGTFVFRAGGVDADDEQVPIAYGDAYQEGSNCVRYESDMVPFKTGTDIVLCATAHAPKEIPADAVPVAVMVGAMEKRLMVFGERFWNHAGVLSRKFTMTGTKPFIRRPIVYEDAYGGIDTVSGEFCAENLVGKGLYGAKAKQNLAGQPLPGIEDPRCLIQSPHDRPRPVGFGFYNRAWQPRVAYAGTYDQAWREQRCPLPPEDFDPRFYNGAHPDLQVDGFLKGNEPITLINLTPEGRADWYLPDVRLTSAITRGGVNGQREKQLLAMNLDTLFLEPDKQRCCIVWRGSAALGEPAGAGIEKLTIGCKAG